jgi:hypothetical protein
MFEEPPSLGEESNIQGSKKEAVSLHKRRKTPEVFKGLSSMLDQSSQEESKGEDQKKETKI